MKAKRELITNLREKGISNLPIADTAGGTQKLFKVFMLGQGLMM